MLKRTAPFLLLLPIFTLCLAQQSNISKDSPAPAGRIEQAAADLRAAEAAHPGNTAEVATALGKTVLADLDLEKVSADTLAQAQRELAVANAAGGTDSELSLNAQVDIARSMEYLDRGAESRPFAEHAFEVGQQRFPDSPVTTMAANALASICSSMGDLACGMRAVNWAIAAERKAGSGSEADLISSLSLRSEMKFLSRDDQGASDDLEEALVEAEHGKIPDLDRGILENNAATQYLRVHDFAKAIPHFNRSIELIRKVNGPQGSLLATIEGNLADMYTRTGQFEQAWKSYQVSLADPFQNGDYLAWDHSGYARSLAYGGNLKLAIEEGLLAARMGRERFQLQARTLPERQALAYYKRRPWGLNIALSVLATHPELPAEAIYTEAVRSRAMVADEMARRQRNLNASGDPEVTRLLEALNQARNKVLETDAIAPGTAGRDEAVHAAAAAMESIERQLAERSARVRADERQDAVTVDDLRAALPRDAVLVSYVVYQRQLVEKIDPARTTTWSFAAFVLSPGAGPSSGAVRVFDLGQAKAIEDLATKMRAAAEQEAHSGGMGSARNERAYRDAAAELRKLAWDPLAAAIKDAHRVLVVPDGMLDLIPFSSLPDGAGYLIERPQSIAMLSSERDLLAATPAAKKTGLLAVGGPAFDQDAGGAKSPAQLRGDTGVCEELSKITFQPLPGSTQEATQISTEWKRFRPAESTLLLTGAEATRARFLEQAEHVHALHVATHAFVLNRSCGNGNPLLNAGLVFAGVNQNHGDSILTAQQIASMNLDGVEWAVLSACNTGNGELTDGEGVLGLERAFRVAGARSVVMALWPIDDAITQSYTRILYRERLEAHRSTSDAAWEASRKLLASRRAAHQSTHPWYWAGFVAAGDWR